MARSNLPKFGNWESEENVPYTTYFENARRSSSSEKVNTNTSLDDPNLISKEEALRRVETTRTKHECKVSQEDNELWRPVDSLSRHDGGRRASEDSTLRRLAGVRNDALKRAAKPNGAGARSADHSPLHPQYQAKIGTKGTEVSSPAWERNGSSEGTHSLAPSTPGRSRLRSVPRGSETVTSRFTGPIAVEDVIYENFDDHLASMFESKELTFRRLTFQRAEGLVQSEALLLKESSLAHDETRRQTSVSSSKSKKRGKQKTKPSQVSEPSNTLEVDHSFLASSYHTGIIAGFALISSYLESMASGGRKAETVVIGLGAGLLPMFLHKCMHFLHVEVVELDPVVLRLAKDYFSFREDQHLKVHVADGIKFLQDLTKTNVHEMVDSNGKGEAIINTDSSSLSSGAARVRHQLTRKLDIIIVDVDSSDSSSGLSCPAAEFIDDSFLTTVKNILSEEGLFIINLVSRSPSIKNMVVSRIKEVFSHLFCLQLEEDVNEILFAVNSSVFVTDENISEAAIQLEKLLTFEHSNRSQAIVNNVQKIKRLK